MYLSTVSSRLLLYDISSWDLKKSYGCYDGLMRDISWSDDGKYILQVNSKGLIEILSPMDHDIRSLQHIPVKDTWSASFHRDGHRNIAIGTKSGNVMIWDTKNKSVVKTFPVPSHQSSVNHISYNSRNTSLAATMQNGDTIIYGLVSNIPVMTVKLSCSKSISAMKFHQDSRTLLGLATDEGHMVLRDTNTGKDKAYFENAHASPVSDFVFSLINKDVLLSSGYDKNVHVYDIRLQNVVSTICAAYPLTSLSLNAENELAIGTQTGSVLIYDLRNISCPLQNLTGHSEEVHKVAFQPVKRKSLSTEISLKEDTVVATQLSPIKNSPLVRNKTPDIFLVDSSPANHQVPGQDNESKADSFLVMMGLDNTNNDIHDDRNRSTAGEKKSDINKHNKQTDAKLTVTKISTPLQNKTHESFGFSTPLCMAIGLEDEIRCSNNNLLQKPTNEPSSIDTRVMEELKNFIKLTVSDVADDNRNYFLHIMMALTKQKLFLEKQLRGMNDQIQSLVTDHNMLAEMNRKLILEVDQLKTQNNKQSYNN